VDHYWVKNAPSSQITIRHPSLKKMVESLRFESAIGALIVVNAIISGSLGLGVRDVFDVKSTFSTGIFKEVGDGSTCR
jgi:hypothetical protein